MSGAPDGLSPFRRGMYRFYGRLQKAVAPDIRYSQLAYLDALRARVPKGCDWLDLGCGHQMFPEFMFAEERSLAGRASRLVGIEMDRDALSRHRSLQSRVIGNIESLPFRADSFDIVTANMVVEHVMHPEPLLEQARRILRPGGLFIFHTPNRNCVLMRAARLTPQGIKNKLIVLLEGRREEDVFPTQYRLNTIADIRSAAERTGFEIAELKSVNSAAITAVLGPVAVFELLYLRALESPRLENLRSNLIVTLRKR